MSSDKTGLQHVPPHSHPVQPDHKPIGIMPTPKEGFGHVHSGPALISCSNLRMMLVTREDLRTVLDNTMSLEDLVKGSPYHAQLSIFHRAFIWVKTSLYQVDDTLFVSGARQIKLMNSDKLVSVQELLSEDRHDGNRSISNKVVKRITEWACCGKLPPFTVHQAAWVAYRLQRARLCFAAALEASMLPPGAEQNAKTAQYKHCINDLLNSMQGTLPIATTMQYSSKIETAPSPRLPVPSVTSSARHMRHVPQVERMQAIHASDSRTRLQDAPAVQATERTASSAVLSQLSTASSVSARQACMSSCQHECPECPNLDASLAQAFRLANSMAQSPPAQVSAHSSVIYSPPAPVPGTPPFEPQSRASVPQLLAHSKQSTAPLPHRLSPQPASPVQTCANVLPAWPGCPSLAPTSMHLQAMLCAATQCDVPSKVLNPEGPGCSASCSSTAAIHMSKLQSFSSSNGSQAQCASATASQPLLAAGRATSIKLHWRLGQHSHVHGHCAMTAQPLSARELAGPAQPGQELELDACHLVDLREWLCCGPPVMQLHAGTAQATSLLAEPSSNVEFVRLHTLLSCMQQGLLAFDRKQTSGQHPEHTSLMIVLHNQVDVVSSCTQQEEASELCMYAAACLGK